MEVISDVEMPSPKRFCVEAPNIANTAEPPPDYLDDFSDIYGTPAKEEDKAKNGDMSPSVPEDLDAQPNVISPLPSLPGLPGLGIDNISPVHASTVMEVQTEQCFQNDLGRSTEVDMKDPEMDKRRQPEEQRNNGKTPSVNLDASDDAAYISCSTSKLSSANGPTTLNLKTESGKVIAPSEENRPLKASSSTVTVEDPLQDPLAFLEASLPPESTRQLTEHSAQPTDDSGNTKISAEPLTFEDLAMANKQNVDAEFELDSSPLNSDSDSSDGTSSSDDSEDDGYEMLDPEEQARRLMAEDGGSDDDGATAKEKASGPLRTQNEKPDEVVPKPDVIVTEEMRIEELGTVEGTVENVVLIKAKISGEYQVLEQGSVLCLEDRSVVGVVAETLGRVQQPYYSVRFTNVAAIAEAGMVKDTKIFYVDELSTAVFTQPLRAFKGSDASNLHDEEVGDDELEFSDDEAEAEHKRRVKIQRQQRRTGRDGQMDGFSRGPRGGRGGFGRGGGKRGGHSHNEQGHVVQEQMPNAAEAALNYDDNANEMNVDGEDLYTPLARPTNLHEIMGSQAGFSENLGFQRNSNKPSHGRSRGRGDRGGGRGSGHGRGQARGGFGNRGGNSNQQRPNNHLPSPVQQSNGFSQPSAQQYPTNLYQAATSTQHQPFTPYQGQYPPQWNQSATLQYPPQHYPTDAYHPQQQHQTYPQPPFPNSNSNIPAGAHINPAFFRQPQQQQPHQWPPQQ